MSDSTLPTDAIRDCIVCCDLDNPSLIPPQLDTKSAYRQLTALIARVAELERERDEAMEDCRMMQDRLQRVVAAHKAAKE